MQVPILNSEQVAAIHRKRVSPSREYRAMYSTWHKGIIKSPEWMLIPIDDHLVHRGDGVFEALRVSDGAIYDLKGHLDRLEISSDKIQLSWPMDRKDLEGIIQQTVRAAEVNRAIVRLYLSRGPGGFTANPYESVGSQLYLVVTDYKGPSEETFAKGVHLGLAKVPAKENPWHEIKSCNYLQNVMMKKEAVDLGFDFTISVGRSGVLCEGSTENFCIVDSENTMKVPRFDYTLRGTTLLKVIQLADELVQQGELRSVEFADLREGDLYAAQEIFLVGTTLEVLPVTRFQNQAIGQGSPGSVSQKLRCLLLKDIAENEESRTPY